METTLVRAREELGGGCVSLVALSDGSPWPGVSVVMPVRDDAEGLPAAIAAVLAQEYPGRIEVVLAVAPSSDGTASVAAQVAAGDPRVRVVANPLGSASAGLNRAIEASSGEVIARIDGHAEPEPGYLRRAVALLGATGAENVGGRQHVVGRTPFERAVAIAMTSRLGAGDAKFRCGGTAGLTDTVYLGVFRRQALARVGGFDETLLRNQDYELNWRLRDSGGTVWFDPTLRVCYRPRGSLTALARQYFQYGQWKREVIRRHPRSLRWRQLAPPLALIANALGLALGLCSRRTRLALTVPALYVGALAATSAAKRPVQPRLPLIYAVMHVAWGAGFLCGPRARRHGMAGLPERDGVSA